MSHLVIKNPIEGDFSLNVTQFRSPMSSEITSAQTRTMQQHFPIRCGQPDMEFTAQFVNTAERDRFKDMVRRHQVHVQSFPTHWVTLWWPERDILNWTGFLILYPVEIKRFDYAPKVVFGVVLVDSLMSEHTFASSSAAPFGNIIGPELPFSFLISAVDNLLRLPSFPTPAGQPSAPAAPVSGPGIAPSAPNPVLPGVGQ